MGETRKSLLHQDKWRVIDQSAPNRLFPALQSFAVDDTLCHSVGKGASPAVARTWVHYRTVILGIQDTKLPELESGLAFLEEQNTDWIVRNSGGLAVLLDEGVLNISLVFPDTEKGIDINRGYDAMLHLVRRMFDDLDVIIEAGEISGSYCPGSYDLSIGGRKFAGISQRRIRKGVAVQIYLCVSGSGADRAGFLREFYQHAKSAEAEKVHFPVIMPEVMASLSELAGRTLSVEDVMGRFLSALQSFSGEGIEMSSLRGEELTWLPHYIERMAERNNRV